MTVHPLAGKPAPRDLLINVDALIDAYFSSEPDIQDPLQMVGFGTSGHRGTSLDGSFTEAHILAITQAICDYRRKNSIDGPLFIGKDTHALSGPAQRTALEVLAGNEVRVFIQAGDAPTPTPVISHAIIGANRGKKGHLADGIVITPSHNPPADGGFKYNLPNGGPADANTTSWIQDRANDLLRAGNADVQRLSFERAAKAATTVVTDFLMPYVDDLASIIDMEAIRSAQLAIGADPLGGAAAPFWQPIAERYDLNITVVNPTVDPAFAFMSVDHDGKIRMDCSSPYAMAGLVKLKHVYDIAFGNDPDADRHGIVTPSAGLLNPNHYLAVAIDYLFSSRSEWSAQTAVGKTLVSSSMIDRVAAALGRKLIEVPVGFKWFAAGLFDGTLGFGGEESAGASFLRRDGSVWSTDKDGIILNLLAAEITARTEKDPGEHYRDLTERFGAPHYKRVDAAASVEQKSILKNLSSEAVTASELAGEPIMAKLTRAAGNDASIGGLKVVTQNGWFAARPSGTEDIYKIYAESFQSERHLSAIIEQAQQIVSDAFAVSGTGS